MSKADLLQNGPLYALRRKEDQGFYIWLADVKLMATAASRGSPTAMAQLSRLTPEHKLAVWNVLDAEAKSRLQAINPKERAPQIVQPTLMEWPSNV